MSLRTKVSYLSKEALQFNNMKNKKSIKYLLVVVIFVWGIIFWKVYNSFSDPHEISYDKKEKIKIKVENADFFNYELFLDYEDPFLKNFNQKKNSTTQSKNESQTKNTGIVRNANIGSFSVSDNKVLVWPNILYIGKIEKAGSDNQVALLRINNISHMVKEKDTINDLKVLKIYTDSIKMMYKEEIKVINK